MSASQTKIPSGQWLYSPTSASRPIERIFFIVGLSLWCSKANQ